MLQTKINILEETANFIEQNPEEYNWLNTCSCNCGILARTVIGTSKEGLLNLLEQDIKQKVIEGDFFGHTNSITWERIVDSAICSTTGIPLSEVLASLTNKGFTLEELSYLETLQDPLVLTEMGEGKDITFDKSSNVVNYLRAWASLLRFKLAQELTSKPTIKNPVPVTQPVQL